VVIEAMSAGVPVLASRSGGIPEILTGAFERQLVQPGSSTDLARAMIQYRHWRATNPSLGRLSHQHVRKHFSLDNTVDVVQNALTQASAESASGRYPRSNRRRVHRIPIPHARPGHFDLSQQPFSRRCSIAVGASGETSMSHGSTGIRNSD
jgi:hypothetical protein